MKSFKPVTTLSCLRIELRSENEAMPIFLAVPYYTLDRSKNSQLNILRALVFNEVLVITLLRMLAQMRLFYSIQRIPWKSPKHTRKCLLRPQERLCPVVSRRTIFWPITRGCFHLWILQSILRSKRKFQD